MKLSVKESTEEIQHFAPQAGFEAPSQNEITKICEHGASDVKESEAPSTHTIPSILYSLRLIIAQEQDAAEIARAREFVCGYLRQSKKSVLPDLNVYKLVGKKLDLELWATSIEEFPESKEVVNNNVTALRELEQQIKPLNETFEEVEKSGSGSLFVSIEELNQSARTISSDINYLTLIPNITECVRNSLAWNGKKAPYCGIFKLKTNVFF